MRMLRGLSVWRCSVCLVCPVGFVGLVGLVVMVEDKGRDRDDERNLDSGGRKDESLIDEWS